MIAEDTPAVRRALAALLKSAGYGVRAVADGDEALAALAERRPDLLLLDVMMPRKNGYTVVSEIRRTDQTLPVIILTAKAEPSDQVLGLGLGCDDYLAKPFENNVLLARIAALLRRAHPAGEARDVHAPAEAAYDDEGFHATPEPDFMFGRHRVSLRRLEITDAAGAVERLRPREAAIFQLFARHPHEVIHREDFLGAVWGIGNMGTTRTVDQYIVRLRKLLGDDAPCIETISGGGYRFEPRRAIG